MAAAFSEVAIGRAGDLGLLAVDRLNDDPRRSDGVVETAAGDWALGGVDDDSGFEVVRSRHALRLARVAQREKEAIGAGLVPNERDESGRIDDHFGKPRSS